MWGGCLSIACRSDCGVSPVRSSVLTPTSGSPCSAKVARISARGSERFFWTSFDSALSGETYRTWISSRSSPFSPCRTNPSIAERKAANVLPEPVGAAMSTSPPSWMTGQARLWGSVGSAKRLANQRSMTGWKRDSGIRPEIYPKLGLAAKGGDPLDGFPDFVIGGRCACRDTNRQSAFGQPPLVPLFGRMQAHRAMADAPILHIDARCILDMVRRDLLAADGREMRGVARVVAADHHHQIERLGDQLEHGILPFLRSRADRVERAEMFAESLGAPAPRHALPHLTGDGERFAREHRGLIGDADALQVAVGIEARRHLAFELLQKLLPRPPSLDVLADDPCLIHIPHHEVIAAGIFVDLAGRGLRFFVVVLAVDQGGEAVARVHLDALPDVQDRSARRVDEHAADRAQALEVPHRHAKRRENHDVAGAHGAEVELTIPPFRPVQEFDAHRGEVLVDARVVDDLADQERALAGKLGARFVRILDRAVHAVTEAELAGEPECHVADLQRVSRLADEIDDTAVIIGRKRAFDRAFEAEAFAEVGLFHGLNLTGHRARRGSRRARAAPASHHGRWPVRPAVYRHGSPAPSRAATGRKNAPTCCWASSSPRGHREPRHPRAAHLICRARGCLGSR